MPVVRVEEGPETVDWVVVGLAAAARAAAVQVARVGAEKLGMEMEPAVRAAARAEARLEEEAWSEVA